MRYRFLLWTRSFSLNYKISERFLLRLAKDVACGGASDDEEAEECSGCSELQGGCDFTLQQQSSY